MRRGRALQKCGHVGLISQYYLCVKPNHSKRVHAIHASIIEIQYAHTGPVSPLQPHYLTASLQSSWSIFSQILCAAVASLAA